MDLEIVVIIKGEIIHGENVFHSQICKFVKFLLPSSSWLLKLPIIRSL